MFLIKQIINHLVYYNMNDNNNNINDNIKKFSQIFENYSYDKTNEENNLLFISTEKWIAQLGRRITS